MTQELLRGSTIYDNKINYYSLGVIIYFILNEERLPEINIINNNRIIDL